MDPSLIDEDWQCRDNPDEMYNKCSYPEQGWDKQSNWKYVENKYTCGSVVWARLEGWPAWPAMVDDDPDTGEFFWTGVEDNKWEDKPSWYHVVFFESNEKNVTRAWIADRCLEKFAVESFSKGNRSQRLHSAINVAREATRESLETRRKKYCLATRFKGPWGSSVWPEYDNDSSDSSDSDGESQVEDRRGQDEFEISRNENFSSIPNHDNSDQTETSGTEYSVPKQLLALLDNSQDRVDESEVRSSIDSSTVKDCIGNRSESIVQQLRKSPQSNKGTEAERKEVGCTLESLNNEVSPSEPNAVAVEKEALAECALDTAEPSFRESCPPHSQVISDSYKNNSVFTQELSPVKEAIQSQASFHFDDEDSLDKSVIDGISSALSSVENFTPLKQDNSKNREDLVHSPHIQSPQQKFETSTPLNKNSLQLSKPSLISPGGDGHSKVSELSDQENKRLNTTDGSTAFSEDDSFMEI